MLQTDDRSGHSSNKFREQKVGGDGYRQNVILCWGLVLMLCLNSAPKITQESACPDAEGPCPQLVFD